jgi:predicted acyl esterase
MADVMITLREGVQLNATLYTPEDESVPRPSIVTLTPYIAQTCQERGASFASSRT